MASTQLISQYWFDGSTAKALIDRLHLGHQIRLAFPNAEYPSFVDWISKNAVPWAKRGEFIEAPGHIAR